MTTTLVYWIAWDCLSRAKGNFYQIDRKFITQVGDDATMEAYYKGLDIHTIMNTTWYMHDQRMVLGGRFTLSRSNTVLTIKDIELQDKGDYKAIAHGLNNSTYVTKFTLFVHLKPIPKWAVVLIILGLILILVGTVIFFKCRREVTDIVVKRFPRARDRTSTTETSFQQ